MGYQGRARGAGRRGEGTPCMPARDRGSERAQEIEEVLLVLAGERVEQADHRVGFGAWARVSLDRREQSAVVGSGAAVVQEENALPRSPERRGAKLIGSGGALADLIRQPRPHVMHRQVGGE